MKHTLSVLIACFIPLVIHAQDDGTVMLQFPKSDVRTVLVLYEHLTGKPVFTGLDLQALVTIQPEKRIPPAAAIELIRTTLLERYGIEFRTTDQGETLVAWSKDPKYPRYSEPPMTQAERDALPKSRIRIIK